MDSKKNRNSSEIAVSSGLTAKRVLPIGGTGSEACNSASTCSVCVSLTDGTPIELRVSDSGIGIAPDRLDAIFRPFEQAEANTSTRYGGTGLGLSISRSMAEMLGGSLMVESTPGLGSTFTFRVPVGVSVPVAEAVDA